ncbi:tetratricopeptide repeat protein [bacterium]|nr:tetratricopeptide repeat protein [bacterium]
MTIIEHFNNWIGKHWVRPYAVLILMVFAGYGSGLKNGYALDDHFVTTPENEQVVKGVSGIGEIFRSNYDVIDGKGYGYRPMAEATFALEYELFGWNVKMSHLINILLMILAGALLFSCIRRLFSAWNVFWCLMIAVLFALHPLHNEVVNSLKNRDELLVAIFGLGSLRLFITYFKSGTVWTLVAGIVAYALGFFTKNSMVPFVFFIPLTLYMFSVSSLKKSLLLFVVLAVVGKLANFTGHSLLGNTPTRTLDWIENPLVTESTLTRLINMPYYFWIYVKLHVWPWPLLSYYGLHTLELQSAGSFLPYLGIVLGVTLLVLTLIFIKKQREMSWGILTFLLFLAPYLNFPFLAPGLIAERFTFMSVLGFVVFLVSFFIAISKWQRLQSLSLFVFIIFGVYLVINNVRNPDWKDLTSLLKADVANAPNSIKLNTIYAEHLHATFRNFTSAKLQEEQVKLAARHYIKAIDLYPNNSGIYENLGILCIDVQQYENAIDNFNKALRNGGDSAITYFHIGAVYELQGKKAIAERYYRESLKISPNYFEPEERLREILK